jgi:hypothetical protein
MKKNEPSELLCEELPRAKPAAGKIARQCEDDLTIASGLASGMLTSTRN